MSLLGLEEVGKGGAYNVALLVSQIVTGTVKGDELGSRYHPVHDSRVSVGYSVIVGALKSVRDRVDVYTCSTYPDQQYIVIRSSQ